MAVDDIVDKILNDANKEAAVIRKDSQAEASKILKDAKEKASVNKKEYLDTFNQYVQSRTKKIITNANIEAKKIILTQKVEIIDEVFKQAATRLDKSALPKKTVILKDTQKYESIDPFDYIEQVKLRLAGEVVRILEIE